ncbi:MAG: gliding motility-associated C-terminal domain-containing protein [Bacteroidales bacterium]
MKKLWILLFVSITTSLVYAQNIEVSGGTKTPIPYTNISGSGLNNVFVLYGLENAKLTYQSSTGNLLKWFKYTTNINDSLLVKSGDTFNTELTGLENNTGYILQDGTSIKRVWIIDYKLYEATSLVVNSTASLDPCSELRLTVTTQLFSMGYNEAKSGSVRRLLNIQIPVAYKSMEYSASASAYVSKDVVLNIANLTNSNITISEVPLMNTSFTIGDDIFAKTWGLNKSVATPEYTAVAVNGKGTPIHVVRDAENELDKGTEDVLEGSGPFDVRFVGYANEPTASYFKWELATDDKFANVFTTFTDKEFQFTFSETKTYYARFTVSNKFNSCTDSSQVFTIKVFESYLKVPRVFSPNGDGKNDVFYAEYKSIKSFHGWIFNRWGNELFTWTDPSKGWDGKVGGKYVNPGVYFYIIEAEGTDGQSHNLKGDINVFSTQP